MSAVRFTKKPSMTWGRGPNREVAPGPSHRHRVPCESGPALPAHLGVGDGLQQCALGKAEVVRRAMLLHEVHSAPQAAAL